jgi:hypothetical protein
MYSENWGPWGGKYMPKHAICFVHIGKRIHVNKKLKVVAMVN